MKVAIVLNTSWNIYHFRMNFIRALQKDGHEIHTIAPKDSYTHYLTEQGCIHHRVRMDSRGVNPIRDLALIIELFWIYRTVKPDVILHYTIKPNIYGSIAASFLGIPVVNNVCGLGTVFLKKSIVSRIAMGLYRISFKTPKKVFFQNPEDMQLFLSRGLVPAASADLLPGSGIDLQKFRPAKFGRNPAFTFLLISRLITDKGIHEYINAIQQLRNKGLNARFQILGAKDPKHKRGIKIKTINEWIKSGIVEYLGTSDDVRPFIHHADCIVLPSYREGTPRTLLEAASSSKPIITTDVPGCHQVVQDGYNGMLCRVRDVDDLANKMETMSKLDDKTLIAFGENGRKKMESQYDERVVIEKYLNTLIHFKKAS